MVNTTLPFISRTSNKEVSCHGRSGREKYEKRRERQANTTFYRLKSTSAAAGNHAKSAGYPDGFWADSEKTANFLREQGETDKGRNSGRRNFSCGASKQRIGL